MPDVFTKEKRSDVMSKIRGRGNRDTELAVLRLLRERRITGWRRHLPLPGRPDFAFRGVRLALFVDGCFWHQCPRCSNVPENNREFWQLKLARNVARDRAVTRTLRSAGWRVLRLWEHELRRPPVVVRRIERALASATVARPASRTSRAATGRS